MRQYPYVIKIDGQTAAGFTEVTGLSMETDPIDYRNGDGPQLSPRKLPHTGFNVVTLNRGVVHNVSFTNWLQHVGTRRHLTIEHHDAGGRLLWSRVLMDCAITEHRSTSPSAIEKITLTYHHQRPS